MNPEFAPTLSRLTQRLLDSRAGQPHWTGELSSSALSTATASVALSLAGGSQPLVDAGLRWLEQTQNPDGGWGDTDRSATNISTTALCWAAFVIAARPSPAVPRCERWLQQAAGSLQPATLAPAIASRYGDDHTFSVPILTVLAIAGLVPWSLVPQLPFELAALPRTLFRRLGLPVVSYALPALIAIGLVRHRLRPSRNPLSFLLRRAAAPRALRVLGQVQPANGGFLEAVPLTSFVCLSLIAAGETAGHVLSLGLDFLRLSVRQDGSWPIDTNLSTWVTTLSINALGPALPDADRQPLTAWLLAQQYTHTHPYTGAPPGAWAWTPLPGAVPDADDTAGALLALHTLSPPNPPTLAAAAAGVAWLLDLQNRDGGIPTFCRGWTKLPFDRSSPDITAHALLAWSAWAPHLPPLLQRRIQRALPRALDFLERAQRPDGAWIPLWFGNQSAVNDENPVYGTSRVLPAIHLCRPASPAIPRAIHWLLAAQNPDGGWGGDSAIPSTIEETSLAVTALSSFPNASQPAHAGASWIVSATRHGEDTPPFPCGFYFARLWYYEQLYPLIFPLQALRR